VPDLAALGVALVRAPNAGPFTLTGTNTWVLGRDPAWVIDPGPALPEHLAAVAAEVAARGGAGGIAITHDHQDHVEGLNGLLERLVGRPRAANVGGDEVANAGGDEVPVVWARGRAADGDSFGPLRVLALPGHSDDHLVFVADRVLFSGDAVLGEGSVFVAGQLGAYLDGLRRLRELDLAVICPGHGPPVWDARAKLDEYLAHRLERERRVVAALERGLRTEDELLDAAWDDVPPPLRGAAAVTLRAHLEKLAGDGRLPSGGGR
jgi:glyoxylase-like metal-dependent hydrolase (beta-lactamase superfamily II)